ncbi:hypothetical protein [Psychroserpens ponticola]|uniref:Uncharacterized protein n=1 Tax=Psychroserpens ponticola TaxID=2932268 RepID=A0ABY7S184_9FLAO|nr:hypothetical protein [Psychroserpens ponticola]WCO02929.1 hypothetical protein MUN68_005410 [Psychroserpens ponticola]
MKHNTTSTILNLILGFCFLVAYPNTDVSFNSEIHLEVLKSKTESSSVKSVSHLHANDYSERITTHNQNTFTPQYLKKHSDADIKSNISKYQTLVKRNKYLQYSRNLFLNFLNTDIIFPFHTFW